MDSLDTTKKKRRREPEEGRRTYRELVLVHSPEATTWRRPLTGTSILGRVKGADRVSLVDEQITRNHAKLEWDSDSHAYSVEDLGSTNGTYVDGRKVRSQTLEDGSILRVGDSLLIYQEFDVRQGFDPLARPDGTSYERWCSEQLAHRIGASSLPVLILGPTGSGKERLASIVHASSKRTPFVAVNCAALVSSLADSELFGHKKGAFVGASEDRPGLIRTADHGTLFLDEIGDLPLELQPKLLRTLETGRVRPVGSDEDIAVDVRFVAATSIDLDAKLLTGQFRAELYARLNGFEVTAIPLRDRREEIIPLFYGFLRLGSARLSADAAERLLCHDWPLNVRELRRTAEALTLFAAEVEVIGTSFLPGRIQKPKLRQAASPIARGARPSPEALAEALRAEGGNVERVAQKFGRQPMQIRRWARYFGLDLSEFRRGT